MRPRSKVAAPCGLALMVLAVGASSVQAAHPTPLVRLTYDRDGTAADCPDRAAVLDAVRARLGYDPFREPAEILIESRVERRGEQLNATLKLSSAQAQPQGERHLTSERADDESWPRPWI